MQGITVKARKHHGAKSLNLTIPVKIRETYNIEPGDIFEITVDIKDGKTLLLYNRIYSPHVKQRASAS